MAQAALVRKNATSHRELLDIDSGTKTRLSSGTKWIIEQVWTTRKEKQETLMQLARIYPSGPAREVQGVDSNI